MKFTSIVCLGAGGNAVFHIVRYLHILGNTIVCYEIKENDRTKKLQRLKNVDLILENPAKSFDGDIAFIIYTAELPEVLVGQIRKQNPLTKMVEAGEFVNELTEKFEKGSLSKEEEIAFRKSQIGPLYSIDYSKQKFIGVTGTDGKTTTCFMLYHILRGLGQNPGMISTVEARLGNEIVDTGLHTTTPSAQELYKLIKRMQEKKCTHVILECTSHGLLMGRLAGVKLDIAIFTNIKKDHLDFHKTWREYARAKSLLITRYLKATGVAVLNGDDKKSFAFLNSLVGDARVYTTKDSNIKETKSGLSFRLDGGIYLLPLLGRYNVENALAAIEACKLLGIKEARAAILLESFKAVCGRMNVLQVKPFCVVVDFAHTPNALKRVLESAKNLKGSRKSRIILVFGCAGKRDSSKRFPMGKIARKYADITLLTAEDPRLDSLVEINNDIARGWSFLDSPSDRKRLVRFDNDSIDIGVRRNAIKRALSLAKDGDVVLVTGKGHERSLCFGTEEYAWNDIEEVRGLLKDILRSEKL